MATTSLRAEVERIGMIPYLHRRSDGFGFGFGLVRIGHGVVLAISRLVDWSRGGRGSLIFILFRLPSFITSVDL